MEYVIGSILTLTTLLVAGRLFSKDLQQNRIKTLIYRQSHTYDMIKDYAVLEQKEKRDTQASKHFKSQFSRILYMEGLAYWIKSDGLYVADFDGANVDESSARKVDMYAVDDVELKKMIFIVEKLTEGTNNDSRNSGN